MWKRWKGVWMFLDAIDIRQICGQLEQQCNTKYRNPRQGPEWTSFQQDLLLTWGTLGRNWVSIECLNVLSLWKHPQSYLVYANTLYSNLCIPLYEGSLSTSIPVIWFLDTGDKCLHLLDCWRAESIFPWLPCCPFIALHTQILFKAITITISLTGQLTNIWVAWCRTRDMLFLPRIGVSHHCFEFGKSGKGKNVSRSLNENGTRATCPRVDRLCKSWQHFIGGHAFLESI